MEKAVIKIGMEEIIVSDSTAKVYQHFSKKIKTTFFPDFIDIIFVRLFQITYLKDIVDYYCKENITRSNWT